MTRNLAAHFKKERPEVDLADTTYTLHVGRASLPHRRALVCQNRD